MTTEQREVIYKYIGKGYTDAAVNALVTWKVDGAINLSAQYYALQREKNMGVINGETAAILINQINNSILSLAGLDEMRRATVAPIAPIADSSIVPKVLSNEEALVRLGDIIKTFKRINPELSDRANKLRQDWNSHDVRKKTEPLYDKKGRIERILKTDYDTIIKEASDNQDKSVQNQQKQVEKLLDGIPSWANLQKAFDIAVENGFASSTVETQLKAKKGSDMLKAGIAGEIEIFMESL
jgi:hypothetical protein